MTASYASISRTKLSLYQTLAVRSASLGGIRMSKKPAYSAGASKFAHHFGRARAGTLAEQLTLHDCVSHGSSPLLLAVASGVAAALAAGEDNGGAADGAVELTGGGAVCGTTGSTPCGSFRGKRSPVAHPASAKTRQAITGRIILFYNFLAGRSAIMARITRWRNVHFWPKADTVPLPAYDQIVGIS